jgi:class 3 adenylate cyclase/predicted ATPase
MTFDEVLAQVLELLRRQGRVSYGALKRRFALDDAYLNDLKSELIEAQRLAMDEEGRVLVWIGAADVAPVLASEPQTLPPSSPPDAQLSQHAPPPVALRAPAERRQLTVLFCDLVGATALSTRLDPEDLREVIRAYQATCTEVIQRFDGHVAQHLGDGLLVYFGYPQAHEDDAQRAVRAGLAIVAALRILNTRLECEQGLRLALRLGIHTGLVVVGEMGGEDRREPLALGDTPMIAARLQELAPPDGLVISAVTARLVQGYFACQPLGVRTLPGVVQPLEIAQVLRESEAYSRLDLAPSHGFTPLVGRDTELRLLLECWERVKEGLGQVVLLSGEAGIGKSRLVQVVKDQVATEPHTRLECRCSPYYQHTALYPIIELLERVLRLQQEDTVETKLTKLEHTLRQFGLPLAEAVPFVANVLSLPLPADRYPPLVLSPQRQKQRTLDTILALVMGLTELHPVLVILEDLHWVDPTTVEFLHLLLDQGPTVRLLTLLTCRPEFQPPWGVRTHLTPLTLQRLPPVQAHEMVARMTGGKPLPPEVTQQIVTKTDGVPLFVEELTKMVLESGLLREEADHYVLTGPLPPLAIPTTLHDSLMARLDRLAAVKVVAQLGATIGRSFGYELLQAVSPLPEATLQHGLRQLMDAELLYQRGVPPQATYQFKHALIQEAAYQSLLRSTRQQYHQRIAQVLEARFPTIVETQPELLAHHYTVAGFNAQAIGYWQQAGQRAIERSANVEAVSHLTKGLELLQTLPDTGERMQQELMLHITLGVPLMATKGYAAAEVEMAYMRARELCQQLEGRSGVTPPVLFPVLHGLYRFYIVRANFPTARELGEQLLSLAQRIQDPALLLEAHMALGIILFFLGELVPARAHVEQGIALYDPQQHRSHAFLYGQDPGVVCRCYAAWALWHLGYPDQGLKTMHESLTLAQELAHPYSLVFALNIAAMQHQHRREGPATQERAEAAMRLSTEQDFLFWLAWSTVLRGWALTEAGQGAEGIAQMRQGLATWQAIGVEIARPYALARLAEAYAQGGQVEAALTVVAEALTAVHHTGERFHEAELHRLRGELLLHSGVQSLASGVSTPDARGQTPDMAAEESFQQALAVARRQQAKSLELRAAMSLSRLWQRQGKYQEAHDLLAPIYGWFTEGFDSVDLQEARALLEEGGE